VSGAAERETRRVRVAEGFTGTARIAGYTVLYEGDRPARNDPPVRYRDGARVVAVGSDPALSDAASPGDHRREFGIGSGEVHLAH
jgi:hypothetical protein